ncbi:MAG: hypothetical protein MJY46_03900 [Bacteroidales bacterium]|nr:hypothetical protein [Bacteroidales bacterium]
MNILSIMVLAGAAVCFSLAVVAIVRKRKSSGRCSGCSMSALCDKKSCQRD